MVLDKANKLGSLKTHDFSNWKCTLSYVWTFEVSLKSVCVCVYACVCVCGDVFLLRAHAFIHMYTSYIVAHE